MAEKYINPSGLLWTFFVRGGGVNGIADMSAKNA